MARTSTQTELRRLRTENEQLRQANAQLKAQLGPRNSLPIWRRAFVVVLTIVAIVILTAGNLVFWAGNTIVKNDRFVATTAPVIEQPEVQSAIAAYTTDQLFMRVNVEQYIEEALPPRAEFLAPNLSQQVETQTQNALQKGLANERFQEEWNAVLARQHERLISIASAHEGDGTISLNDVYQRASQRLESTKLSFLANRQLPTNVGSVTVIDAPWLPKFHNLVVHIDLWRTLAILSLVVCLALAVWLSQNRRQTLYMFSLGVLIAMFATLISLRFGQEAVAGSVDPSYSEAVRVTFQVITQGLVVQTWLLAAAASVVALVAWISGQSRSATTVKEKVVMSASGTIHRQLFGDTAHPALIWVRRHKIMLQWLVVAAATLIVLMVRLTAGVLTAYIVITGVIVFAIEILAAPEKERRVTRRKK